jgi:hypothetical protein
MPGLPRKASSEPLRHVTLKKAQRPQDEPLRAVAKSKEKKLKERGAVTRLRNCSPYLGAYGPEDHFRHQQLGRVRIKPRRMDLRVTIVTPWRISQ